MIPWRTPYPVESGSLVQVWKLSWLLVSVKWFLLQSIKVHGPCNRVNTDIERICPQVLYFYVQTRLHSVKANLNIRQRGSSELSRWNQAANEEVSLSLSVNKSLKLFRKWLESNHTEIHVFTVPNSCFVIKCFYELVYICEINKNKCTWVKILIPQLIHLVNCRSTIRTSDQHYGAIACTPWQLPTHCHNNPGRTCLQNSKTNYETYWPVKWPWPPLV